MAGNTFRGSIDVTGSSLALLLCRYRTPRLGSVFQRSPVLNFLHSFDDSLWGQLKIFDTLCSSLVAFESRT